MAWLAGSNLQKSLNRKLNGGSSDRDGRARSSYRKSRFLSERERPRTFDGDDNLKDIEDEIGGEEENYSDYALDSSSAHHHRQGRYVSSDKDRNIEDMEHIVTSDVAEEEDIEIDNDDSEIMIDIEDTPRDISSPPSSSQQRRISSERRHSKHDQNYHQKSHHQDIMVDDDEFLGEIESDIKAENTYATTRNMSDKIGFKNHHGDDKEIVGYDDDEVEIEISDEDDNENDGMMSHNIVDDQSIEMDEYDDGEDDNPSVSLGLEEKGEKVSKDRGREQYEEEEDEIIISDEEESNNKALSNNNGFDPGTNSSKYGDRMKEAQNNEYEVDDYENYMNDESYAQGAFESGGDDHHLEEEIADDGAAEEENTHNDKAAVSDKKGDGRGEYQNTDIGDDSYSIMDASVHQQHIDDDDDDDGGDTAAGSKKQESNKREDENPSRVTVISPGVNRRSSVQTEASMMTSYQDDDFEEAPPDLEDGDRSPPSPPRSKKHGSTTTTTTTSTYGGQNQKRRSNLEGDKNKDGGPSPLNIAPTNTTLDIEKKTSGLELLSHTSNKSQRRIEDHSIINSSQNNTEGKHSTTTAARISSKNGPIIADESRKHQRSLSIQFNDVEKRLHSLRNGEDDGDNTAKISNNFYTSSSASSHHHHHQQQQVDTHPAPPPPVQAWGDAAAAAVAAAVASSSARAAAEMYPPKEVYGHSAKIAILEAKLREQEAKHCLERERIEKRHSEQLSSLQRQMDLLQKRLESHVIASPRPAPEDASGRSKGRMGIHHQDHVKQQNDGGENQDRKRVNNNDMFSGGRHHEQYPHQVPNHQNNNSAAPNFGAPPYTRAYNYAPSNTAHTSGIHHPLMFHPPPPYNVPPPPPHQYLPPYMIAPPLSYTSPQPAMAAESEIFGEQMLSILRSIQACKSLMSYEAREDEAFGSLFDLHQVLGEDTARSSKNPQGPSLSSRRVNVRQNNFFPDVGPEIVPGNFQAARGPTPLTMEQALKIVDAQ
mmetsp:Transcript_31118/g.52660  ORF Transcript_31118/g.52660 Transcript_31118/m.52660 type:complete len:991 (+) Transcript_31118:187-3159(+)